MVFITTGQRIATENFADGVIYKVTFVDTTISYMMCVGIGQDFVMLQGPNPSLFCLTMSSASRVSTIDIHDPTPPEPPTPIENALQYQTGEPPFTFTTTESSLFSWYIEGPCGVKTANLYNKLTAPNLEAYPRQSDMQIKSNSESRTTYIPCKADTTYTVIKTAGKRLTLATTATTPDIGVPILDITENTTGTTSTITTDSTAQYLVVWYWYSTDTISEQQMRDSLMIIEGSTAPSSYEPYGYKISILSNDNAETIYLDEPIAEGEKLYSVNIDAQIETDIGENTLSVTPTPPDMQIVYGIYAEA